MAKKLLGNRDFLILLALHLINHFLMFTIPLSINLFIRKDLGLNYEDIAWIWTLFIVIMTTVSFFVGIYSDDHPEMRFQLIFVGIAIMIIGWFLILVSQTFTQLGLTYAFIGLGASTFHPPAMAITTQLFEEDKGKALSYFQGIGMGGNAITPIIFAGIQYLTNNWKITTGIYAVIIALASIYLFLQTRNTGLMHKTEWNEREVENKVNNINQETSSIWFILTPLLLIPLIFMSVRTSFLRTSTLFTSLIYNDYVNLSENKSQIASGTVLGIAALFLILGGWITDKYRARNAILISSIGTFIAAFGLAFIANYEEIFGFTLFYFSLNATYFIGAPATSALLANRVDPNQRGKLFGVLFSLGQVLSLGTPLVFGYLEENYDLETAFTFIFILASIAFILGMYIFYEERTRERKNPIEGLNITRSL
jgi:FSR family fosmidomycin resistance protein-like MFS transporter